MATTNCGCGLERRGRSRSCDDRRRVAAGVVLARGARVADDGEEEARDRTARGADRPGSGGMITPEPEPEPVPVPVCVPVPVPVAVVHVVPPPEPHPDGGAWHLLVEMSQYQPPYSRSAGRSRTSPSSCCSSRWCSGRRTRCSCCWSERRSAETSPCPSRSRCPCCPVRPAARTRCCPARRRSPETRCRRSRWSRSSPEGTSCPSRTRGRRRCLPGTGRTHRWRSRRRSRIRRTGPSSTRCSWSYPRELRHAGVPRDELIGDCAAAADRPADGSSDEQHDRLEHHPAR